MTGDIGKITKIKSFSSGNVNLFFKLKSLFLNHENRNIRVNAIKTTPINLKQTNKNFELNPLGIINLIIVMQNSTKNVLMLKSNNKFELNLVFKYFSIIYYPI